MQAAEPTRETPIGQGWGRGVRWWALGIAAGPIAFDFWAAGAWSLRPERALLALLAVLALVGLPGARAGTIGWTHRPRPGWGPWLWMFGLTVFACAAAVWIDVRPARIGENPHPQWERFEAQGARVLFELWVFIPLVEELLYRVALGSALVACFGARWALVLGTLVFAGLHWRYDQLLPVHVFAGLFLTWAYLRSGSLWVPLGIHVLANAIVFVMIAWISG